MYLIRLNPRLYPLIGQILNIVECFVGSTATLPTIHFCLITSSILINQGVNHVEKIWDNCRERKLTKTHLIHHRSSPIVTRYDSNPPVIASKTPSSFLTSYNYSIRTCPKPAFLSRSYNSFMAVRLFLCMSRQAHFSLWILY